MGALCANKGEDELSCGPNVDSPRNLIPLCYRDQCYVLLGLWLIVNGSEIFEECWHHRILIINETLKKNRVSNIYQLSRDCCGIQN